MSQPPLISGIEQIHISVTDLDRSIDFYHRQLGLPLQFVIPEQKMAFLSCGDVRIYLGHSADPKMQSRPMLYFRVADINHAVQRLTAQGIEFNTQPQIAHRTETQEMWLAGFTDPDGNTLVLTAYQELGADPG